MPICSSVTETGAYRHSAGTGIDTVNVPAGEMVEAWSLLAGDGGPAQCIITSPVFGVLPTITVPSGKSFNASPVNLFGPCSLSFVGDVASWFVERNDQIV